MRTQLKPEKSYIGTIMKNYKIADFNAIEPVKCPCGQARRAFTGADNTTATLHITEIKKSSRVHYHKTLTEIYLVLEGETTDEGMVEELSLDHHRTATPGQVRDPPTAEGVG